MDRETRKGAWIIRATIEHDDSHGAPWIEDDGHGPVSDWTMRVKLPGELVLSGDGRASCGTDHSKRYYDFAEACRIARRDGWGPSPYSDAVERGANGLHKRHMQFFDGRTLLCADSDWHDCPNASYAQCYERLRAMTSPRQYAAMAARDDYERLRAWCNDEWSYVGVIVTVSHAVTGIELGSASLWGIESDAGDYLEEIVRDLEPEAIEDARNTLAVMMERAE